MLKYINIVYINNLKMAVERSKRHSLFSLFFCFQELLVILFLFIVASPFQQKIKTMTVTLVTVLWTSKEPGGIQTAVISPTLTVCIITDNTHHVVMESTGITGKDTTTPPRELWWKSDQLTFRTFSLFPSELCKNVFVKETESDSMNKNNRKYKTNNGDKHR